MSRMTAREMFEENGWEAQEERLAYWKEDSHKKWCISFLRGIHEIHFYGVDDEERWSVQYFGALTPNDICAIVQQCYELGWYVEVENEQNDTGVQTKEEE